MIFLNLPIFVVWGSFWSKLALPGGMRKKEVAPAAQRGGEPTSEPGAVPRIAQFMPVVWKSIVSEWSFITRNLGQA